MSRPIEIIISHIRSIVANPRVHSTLIQTEDLLALCEAAEKSQTTSKENENAEPPRQ